MPATTRTRLRAIKNAQWPRSYPVAQFPNAPLAVALGATVAEHFTDGRAHDYAEAIAFLALGVWAYGEAASGDNLFRRLLGSGFLVYLVIKLADRL